MDQSGRDLPELPGLSDLFQNQQYSGGKDGDVFQMLWDCRFCGTTKLLGLDHRHCPNCGAPQNPEWRYFPSNDDIRFVTSTNYRYAGVDRVCPFCQQPNSAAAKFCVQCGADQSSAPDASQQPTTAAGLEGVEGKRQDITLKKAEEEAARLKAQQRSRWGAWISVIGLLAVLACVGLFVYLATSTYPVQLQVEQIAWERVIRIERYTAIEATDWQDRLPFGAYNLVCYPRERAYYDTVREQCGFDYIDRGDGTGQRVPRYCDRQITRYETVGWCSYTINRWVFDRALKTSGGPDDPLVWPRYTEFGSGVGSTREAGRSQTLTVLFLEVGTRNEFIFNPTDEGQWRSFGVRQRYTVSVNRLGIVRWESLQLTPQ